MSSARRRVLAVALLSAVIVLGTTGAAFAGTVKVNLKSDNWQYIAWNPHINAATIYVYGPSSYYRSATYGGVVTWGGSSKTATYSFTGTPNGAYRVRVGWKSGVDSSVQEANQYFTTWWLFPDKTCDFVSP